MKVYSHIVSQHSFSFTYKQIACLVNYVHKQLINHEFHKITHKAYTHDSINYMYIYIYIYPFILSIVDEYDKVTDIVLYICNMHILRGYRECHQIALLGVLW